MDKQANNTMKKVAALAVTTALVVSPLTGIPAPISLPVSITASASTYTSGTVNMTSLKSGDLLYSGVTVKSNYYGRSDHYNYLDSAGRYYGSSWTVSGDRKVTSISYPAGYAGVPYCKVTTTSVSIFRSGKTTCSADGWSTTYNGETQGPPTAVYHNGSFVIPGQYYGTSGTTRATNAGNYSFTITGQNGYAGSMTFKWTIKKANISPKVSCPNVAYPTAPSPSVSGNPGKGTVTYTWYNSSGSKLSAKPTTPGSYKVSASVGATTNYNSGSASAVSFTISNGTPSYTAPTAKNLTYNGSAQALVNVGSATNGTMYYKLSTEDESKWRTTVPTATNAGTYTVQYKIVGNTYYNNLGPYNVSVTISPKPVTITKEPTAIPGLTYTGQEQTLINGGSATNGTMQYSVDGGAYSTALPKGTNAKTYDVKYRVVADNSNYKGTDPASVPDVKIGAPLPEVTKAPAAINGLKYTGNAQALITAGTATGGTMKYKLSTDTEWKTTVPTATEAGDYTVQWKIFADSNHTDTSVRDIPVTIAAIPSEANPEPKAVDGLVYNGNAQDLVTAGTATGGTMYYSIDNGTTWTTTVPTATNAGNYTVLWKVTGDDNHTDITQKSIPVSIAKHSNEVTVTANTVDYNSSAQALVTAGQPTGGTLKFSTDNTNWNETVPTATNVGKYDVWYKVDGGTNYEDIASTKLTAEIKRAPVELTAPTAKDLTYNGEEQELITKGSVKGGTLQYMNEDGEWNTTIPTGIDARTYAISYRVIPDANHIGIDETPIEGVKIKKHPVKYTVEPEALHLTYNGDEQALLSAGTADYGTVQYSTNGKKWSTSIPTGIDAGDYAVYYRIKGLNSNYETTEAKSATTTIDKATPVVTKPTAKTLKYNGNSQTLVNAGKTSGGTMKYSLTGNDNDWSTVVPSAVNAGTYTVYYKVEGGLNYYDFGPEKLDPDATIAKIPAVVTVAPEAVLGLEWTGNEQYLVTAGEAEGGTLKYKLDDGQWQETPPTATDAGEYTIFYKVFGDENHTSTEEKELEVSISSVSSKWNPAPAAVMGLVYTGDEQELITAGSAVGGTAYYKLDDGEWSTEIPAVTNAGNYTVWYKLKGDTNHYDIEARKIETYIAKIPVKVITAPTAVTVPYNGEAQELMTAGVVEGGTIQYRLENGEWTTSLPKATNADDYTVWYKVDGDENHSDIEPTELKAKITKIDSVLVAAPTVNDLTYNGNEQELLTAGTAEGGTIKYSTDQNNWSVDIPKATNAGSYPVWYMVDGDPNHNSIEPVKLNAEIKKADPTITKTPTAKTMTYNAAAQELVTAGSAINGTLKYKAEGKEWTTDIPTATKAGSYDVQYKVFGNENYNDTEAVTLTSVIEKETPVITVKPEANKLSYTGKAQQLVTAGTTTGGTMVYSLDGTSWDKEIPTGVNAGSYTVYYKVEGNNNYNGIDGGKVEVNIAKVSPYITPEPEIANEGLFGISDTDQELITSGKVIGGTVTYYVYDGYDEIYSGSEIPTVGNINEMGEYEVYYSIKGDSNHKNLGKKPIGELTVDLDQAKVVVHPTVNNGLIYDGSKKELVTAGTAEGGTLQYKVAGVSGWIKEIPTATEVGVYTVLYKVVGDDDHNDSPEYSLKAAIGYTSFTVTFDSNGGSAVDSQTIAEYGCVTEPKDPTWFNHTFLGWYNGSVKYDFDSQVTSNLTLTAKWEITNELLSSNTVSFKDNLNFNFMGKIADDAVDGAYVKVSYLHYGTPTEVIIPVNPDDMYAGKYYRFRCELTASEMTMDVKAELYINGMSEPISTRTRSIRDYCESGLNNKNVLAIEKTLLRATLNYGGYTQAHFGYNPAPYANEGYEDSMDNVNVVSEVNFVKPTEVKEGIGYVGSTVFFRTAPFIRYYFKTDAGSDVSKYNFSINGKTLTPVYDNTVGKYDYYYIESSPELAYQLDKVQNVVVTKEAEEIFNFDYSAVKWAELASSNSTNAKERDMAKSLYAYYVAAKNFVERT